MKKYLVAEHLFTVEAPESVYALMTNYAPFEVTQVDDRQPLFALTMHEPQTELPALSADCQTVYSDTTEDDMPRLDIYRDNGTWILREAINKNAPVTLHMTMSEDFSQAHLYMLANANLRFAVDNATMLLFAFASAKYATLEMHASVTIRGDYGYLFLGKSGTGKSTHSRQWIETFQDAWLLNDDNPVVRLKEDGVYVYGSPWSGKTPCYKNEVRRVGAFVKLLQAPYNKMHTLRLPEAYAYILSSSSGLKIIPEIMDTLFETISRLIQTVQVYGMECLPNHDAAILCAETVMPKS
ncbi:MAG: hypothetical protein J5612_02205 [Paludibacteraceae bacterium]|nr:hypothetical protein [Paludibacteraceae bacterium]